MKRIIIILIASIFLTQTIDAQVQFLGSPTTTVRNRGNFVSDSLFYLPKRQKLPTDTGAVRYSISDSTMYLWTGSQWIKSGISKQDTSSMLSPYIRAAGYGLTKSGQSLLVDTLNIATRAWRQKGIDSVVSLIPAAGVGGSGTTNRIAKFTASGTIGNGSIADSASTVAMTILGTNNVGIGTVTPQYRLHTFGTTGIRAETSSGNISTGIDFASAFVGGRVGGYYSYPGGGAIGNNVFGESANGTIQNIVFSESVFPLKLGTIGAGPLQFYSNSTERLRITSGGNVGINNNNPSYRLDVAGSIGLNYDEAIYFRNVSGTGRQVLAYNGNTFLDSKDGYMSFRTDAAGTITERLRITSGGDVGIGTTSPNIYSSGAFKYLTVSNNTASGYSFVTVAGGAGGGGEIDFGNQTIRHAAIASLDGSILGFYTNNTNSGTGVTERLRIFANGRVFVGASATDAGYQLDVNGTGRFAGALRAQGTIQATNNNDNNSGDFTGMVIGSSTGGTARTASFIKNTSSPYDFTIRTQDNTATTTGSMIFQNGSTETMRITSSGNVGVGTTTPQNDAGYKAVTINGTTGGQIGFYAGGIQQTNMYGDATGLTLVTTAATPMTFLTNSLTRMTITSGGNVGIGTASPSEKLHAVGNILASDNAGSYPRFISTVGAKSWEIGYRSGTLNYEVREDGTTRLAISNGGEVLINTSTDAGDYKLQVSGNIYNTGSAVLAATSGNVGIGVTPSAWNSSWKAVEIQQSGNAITSAAVNSVGITSNAYLDATNWKYGANGTANFLAVGNTDGSFAFYKAASGTAGNTITFTQAMTLNNASELLVNTTSDAGDYKLQVAGNIYNTGSAVLAATSGQVQVGTTSWPTSLIGKSGSRSLIGNEGIFILWNEAAVASNNFAGLYLGAKGGGTNGSTTIAGGVIKGLLESVSSNAGALVFETNGGGGNVERGRINSAGEWIIDASGTDAGDYKLQVNGNGYFKNGQILLDSVTNKSALFASQHSVTGSASSNMFSGTATWNTTGDPNLIYIELTNTASGTDADYIRITDGSNMFRVTKDAGIVTSNPTGSTASKWKLGSVSGGTVTLNTGQYVTVEIAGATYKLAIVN